MDSTDIGQATSWCSHLCGGWLSALHQQDHIYCLAQRWEAWSAEDAHLADKLQCIQVVVLAVEAQLDLAVGALPQRLNHHILVHEGAALQYDGAPSGSPSLCGMIKPQYPQFHKSPVYSIDSIAPRSRGYYMMWLMASVLHQLIRFQVQWTSNCLCSRTEG